MAQDESRSISDNIRWTFQKKFQAGKPQLNLKRMLGYDSGPNGEWVINPEQAEIVRYIFERFVCGQSANKIAEELNQLGKTTVNGKKWIAGGVLTVLRNEKYVGDIEMQKTITKDFLTHRSTINKGEAPRYYIENHHVGIIDRITWDKVQAMLYEKPRKSGDSDAGKKKTQSVKGSPFVNLRCGAVLETGPDAGSRCGEGFFRCTYTNVANGYTDDRSLAACRKELEAEGINVYDYLEKYTYAYPIWRCKRKAGEREGAPRLNGTPDQKKYCRDKRGCLSDAEREAANMRCPSENYHECAIEQSFMEMLYKLKRDYNANGEGSFICTAFKETYDKTFHRVKGSSVSVQRMEALEGQIKELEKKLQETIGRQVTAMREAALEQNAELNEAIARGEISIDDIELDIRNGLKANTIGTSFYNVQEEEGSEVEIYRQLSNDIRQRIESLRKEKATLEKEQGVLGIMKKNFEFFLACIKELPETNPAGMALKVNGLDVQGSLFRKADGTAIEGANSSFRKGQWRMTLERLEQSPDLLHFEKGIYCAFIETGLAKGDEIEYKTNFGVTLTSYGNRRTMTSFLGFKKGNTDETITLVDAPYRVYDNSIQYRRYMKKRAKDRLEAETA